MSPPEASDSSFLELEPLTRPVPDLASTLTTTQAEEDANDANVSFLRTPIFPTEVSSRENEGSRRNLGERIRASRQARGLSLDDHPESRRRYTPSELRQLHEQAYQLTRQPLPGYQGWAPASDSARYERDNWSGLPTMTRSSAEFYDEQRRALLSTTRNMQALARDSGASGGRGSSSGTSTSESSLRTTALLQAVRRNPQFALSRSLLSNHNQSREHSSLESHSYDRDPHPDSQRRPAAGSSGASRQRDEFRASAAMEVATIHDMARRELISDRYHNLHQEERPEDQTPTSKWQIEDAIKYLERLRFCDSYQDSVSSAAAGGFVREEFFTTSHDDFILDTAVIDPPAESSWLRFGRVFSGLQVAPPNGVTSAIPQRSNPRRSRATGTPQLGQAQPLPTNRHSFSYTGLNTSPRTAGSRPRNRLPSGIHEGSDHTAQQFRTTPLNAAAERNLAHGLPDEDDHWPVKVRIYSVDLENMNLTGSMEAYNVPDKNQSTQVPSITTYLEGEIIDFNQHTLQTKNYVSNDEIDSEYWHLLEPFNKLSVDEMVQGLLSKKWMKEQLREQYILMRWKGM
ncbi:MAG: hypothetical protein Q9174_003573 [Haloplaca sp. 1 TL-2023]